MKLLGALSLLSTAALSQTTTDVIDCSTAALEDDMADVVYSSKEECYKLYVAQ